MPVLYLFAKLGHLLYALPVKRAYDGLFEIALLFDRKKIANAILSKANLGGFSVKHEFLS